MSVPAPHFLLYPEAVSTCSTAGNRVAVGSEALADASGLYESGQWRFVLRLPGGETSLEAEDIEEGAGAERLELLAIVRGLEALDQPSRVTLVTSANIERGLKFGLAQWRESDWQWERFGRMTPVKNADLWQRLDRLLEIHTIDCRPERAAQADDLVAPPITILRKGKRLRIDPRAAKSEARNPKSEANSKSKCRNDRNAPGLEHWDLKTWNLFRISDFVLRALRVLCSSLGRR